MLIHVQLFLAYCDSNIYCILFVQNLRYIRVNLINHLVAYIMDASSLVTMISSLVDTERIIRTNIRFLIKDFH